MAEKDELAQLREDLTQQQSASITLLGIVQSIDSKVDNLTSTARSIEAQQIVTDSRLNTIDNRLNAQRVQIDNMHVDMQRSFRQVADTMATKDDLELVRKQMEEAFKLVVGMLDERLPIIRNVQSEGE